MADREKSERDEMLNTSWKRYLKARAIAEASSSIEDGKAAGVAWADWISLFLPTGPSPQ